MRPFRLARIAAQAEGVRLRGMITRVLARVIMAVVALLFLLGAVVFAHIAAWYELRTALNQSFLATTGSLGGADLLLAVILLLLAGRSTPSRVEVEALEVRRKAIEGMASTLNITRLVIPVLRIIANMRRRRRD